MAEIKKHDYIADLNLQLRNLANASDTATTTDVTRSGNEITRANHTAAVDGDITSIDVSGSEIESLLKQYSTIFSRTRKVSFYLNINGVYTYQYSRVARIDSSAPDPTRVQPSEFFFNDLDPGKQISNVKYNLILQNLRGTLNQNFTNWYKNYNYCHSSCHSNVYYARGRR